MDNLCARTKQVDEGTKKLAEEYGSQIRAAVSDPDNQQKAIALVGTAIQIHQQLPGIERRATYRGLKMLGAVPVETPAGRSIPGNCW